MQVCYVNTTHPDFLNGHQARHLHDVGQTYLLTCRKGHGDSQRKNESQQAAARRP